MLFRSCSTGWAQTGLSARTKTRSKSSATRRTTSRRDISSTTPRSPAASRCRTSASAQSRSRARTSARTKKIKVIGLKEDVEIFKTVFDYALKSFRKFRREFISEYKKTHQYFNTTAVKNSYLFGFVKGLDDKFKENVIEHALIVVTPALVKQHVNDRNFTKSRRSRRTVSRDGNVRSQGYADGRKSAM